MNSDLSQIFWKLNKTQWDRQIARWAQSGISYSDLIDGHAVLQWVRQNSSKTRPWGVWLQQMAHASYCLSEIGKPVISTRQTDQSVSLQSKKFLDDWSIEDLYKSARVIEKSINIDYERSCKSIKLLGLTSTKHPTTLAKSIPTGGVHCLTRAYSAACWVAGTPNASRSSAGSK